MLKSILPTSSECLQHSYDVMPEFNKIVATFVTRWQHISKEVYYGVWRANMAVYFFMQ